LGSIDSAELSVILLAILIGVMLIGSAMNSQENDLRLPITIVIFAAVIAIIAITLVLSTQEPRKIKTVSKKAKKKRK